MVLSNVLITGGGGFLGLHLANNLLSKGFQVSLLDNFQRGVKDIALRKVVEHPNASLITGSCSDSSLLSRLPRDFDTIFHLAAIVGVRNVESTPRLVITENIKAVDSMLEFASNQRKLDRFLFASTSEVAAGALENFELPIPSPESYPLAITDLARPRSSYALSKMAGEALCHYSELPTTIFRPHNLYGPRMGLSHVIPELLKKAHEAPASSGVPVSSIRHTRTFCFIEDAVEMLVAIMAKKSCEGATLNLGTQEPEITIEELATLCFAAVGKEQFVLDAGVDEGSPTRRAPDMKLLESRIGTLPRTPIESGIIRTFQWYRNTFPDL